MTLDRTLKEWPVCSPDIREEIWVPWCSSNLQRCNASIFIDATARDQSITQRAFGDSTFTCKGVGILALNS